MVKKTSFVLSAELEAYVSERVGSGAYQNASELMREALREHLERAKRIQSLKAFIEAGARSPDAPQGVEERIRDRAKTRREAKGIRTRL
jgi:antitoxin ParD1/3/4